MNEVANAVVPAAQGRALRVGRGNVIRVTTPKGRQAADFFAFTPDLAEWMSPMHTWVATRSVRPREGDTLLSQRRNPLVHFVRDGADGVHDMLIAACDQARYASFGFEGHHRSCSENLFEALAPLGLEPVVVPQPVNLFTCTRVEPDQRLVSPPNPVEPGSFAEFEALTDLICVISSCPFDLALPDWTINAEGGPTELTVQVLEPSP